MEKAMVTQKEKEANKFHELSVTSITEYSDSLDFIDYTKHLEKLAEWERFRSLYPYLNYAFLEEVPPPKKPKEPIDPSLDLGHMSKEPVGEKELALIENEA